MHFSKKRSFQATLIAIATVTTLIFSISVRSEENLSNKKMVSGDVYAIKLGDSLSEISERNNKKVGTFVETASDLPFYDYAVQHAAQLGFVPAQATTTTPVAATTQAPTQQGFAVGGTLANGNTAGEAGSYAAAKMAEATGVPASTWEYIIARESNGQVNAQNPSGASGLFQTMPGWGSTATVDEQIDAALNAYNSQGLSAWGY